MFLSGFASEEIISSSSLQSYTPRRFNFGNLDKMIGEKMFFNLLHFLITIFVS